MSEHQISRRHAVTGAAGAAVALPLLAACGASPDDGAAAGPTSRPSGPIDLGPTSAVPVGGGKIYAEENVVVTQPTSGTFKAFSATCTHQGCQVASVKDGTIHCPCHLSEFSITDGSVKGGPAPKPLPVVAVTVDGGNLTLS